MKLEMALTTASWRLRRVRPGVAVLAVAMMAPMPARADFFDGARRTFQTDIPHFFQDDIPCAFGGQPTSHTRTSCKSSDNSVKRAPVKAGDRDAAPPAKPDQLRDMPAKSSR
jgi:hypothetical protein